MKQILLLFTASLLFLSSCSSDSSSSENPSSQNLLLKKTIQHDLFSIKTTNYIYDGNKLIKIKLSQGTDVQTDRYTYTGNLITKIEKFHVINSWEPEEDAQLDSTDSFVYNSNNQLIEFKTTTPNSDTEIKTTYSYNNNIVSFQQYEYYPGNTPVLLKTGTITLQNGEIIKVQVVKEFDSYIENYNYDTKNSLFKNVLGYDKLMLTHIIGKQGAQTLINTIMGGISHNFINHGEFEYTYNSDNYPTTATQSGFGLVNTFEFFYE